MTKGFTLIELILVISVLGFLTVGYFSFGNRFLVRNATDNTVNELIGSLRIARANSMFSKGDSNWGVKIEPGKIVLYKGQSYFLRDQTFDEVFKYNSVISLTPSDMDVNFSKLTGDTSEMVMSLSNNVGETFDVSVNIFGNVDVN